jgi:hypothetical protein
MVLIKGPTPRVGDFARAMAAAPIRKGESVTGIDVGIDVVTSCPAAVCLMCGGPLPSRVRRDGRRGGPQVRYCSARCCQKYCRTHAVATSSPTTCVTCGGPLPPPVQRNGRREGRRVRFCSARCRSAAHYRAHRDVVLQRTRARYAANPEYFKAYLKDWFPKNRDKQRAAFQKYRLKNPDRVRATQLEYRLKNLDRMREKGRERYRLLRAVFRKYRLENLDRFLAREREYRLKNRDLLRARGRKYYRLRLLMDALIGASRPLDRLVDFTDDHLVELRRLLSCETREAFAVLQGVVVH